MIGCAGACAHAEIFWEVDVGITEDSYTADSGTFTRLGGDTNFPTPPGFSTGDLRTEGQYGVALTHGSLRGFGIVTAVSNIDLNDAGLSTNAGKSMDYIAGFSDTMTITSPTAPNGTQGVATLAMQIDGVVSGTNQLVDFANQGNLVNVSQTNGDLRLSANSSIDSVSAGIEIGDPATVNNQLLSIDVPFVFGEAFDFDFFLEFDVRAGNLGPDWGGAIARTAVIDFGNTASWAGEPTVRLAGSGDLVNDATFVSGSQTDYTQPITVDPIPAPASAFVFLAGSAAASNRRRKNRSFP